MENLFKIIQAYTKPEDKPVSTKVEYIIPHMGKSVMPVVSSGNTFRKEGD